MLYDFDAIFAPTIILDGCRADISWERITMIETDKPQTASDQLDQLGIAGPISDHLAESRLDPLTGDWTIFSPDRDRRR